MNIRDVPDVTLVTWKKAAVESGHTLKEWVTGILNSAVEAETKPSRSAVGVSGVLGTARGVVVPGPVVPQIPAKIIAKPTKGTREYLYFMKYAKEKNELPSAAELKEYMEADEFRQ